MDTHIATQVATWVQRNIRAGHSQTDFPPSHLTQPGDIEFAGGGGGAF